MDTSTTPTQDNIPSSDGKHIQILLPPDSNSTVSSVNSSNSSHYTYSIASSTTSNDGDICEVDGDKAGIISIPAPEISSTNSLSSEGREENSSHAYGKPIGKDDSNFILMYDMLTGIRHSVSAYQAKPRRPLTEDDFIYTRTYNFIKEAVDLAPSKYEFKFKDYSPWVFRSLRETFKIDAADYLVSLTGKYALSEIGSPGKSGSFFYYSQDFRYIIKTIRKSEHKFLRSILRPYYKHMKSHPNSLLSRFYGLHRVHFKDGSRKRSRKIHFVVLGNIYPPFKSIHESFDLKGSLIGRKFVGSDEERAKATLKDKNWLEDGKKLFLQEEKASLLLDQLAQDCNFLIKRGIMDYSLLVGIHHSERGNSNQAKLDLVMVEPSTSSPDITRFKKCPIVSAEQALNGTIGAANFNTLATIGTNTITTAAAVASKERRKSIFYAEEGGIKGINEEGNEEIYFLGIIDILTPWSLSKKLESAFKSIKFDKKEFSAIHPKDYGSRFCRFAIDHILQKDSKKIYSEKILPELPSLEEEEEECDGDGGGSVITDISTK